MNSYAREKENDSGSMPMAKAPTPNRPTIANKPTKPDMVDCPGPRHHVNTFRIPFDYGRAYDVYSVVVVEVCELHIFDDRCALSRELRSTMTSAGSAAVCRDGAAHNPIVEQKFAITCEHIYI